MYKRKEKADQRKEEEGNDEYSLNMTGDQDDSSSSSEDEKVEEEEEINPDVQSKKSKIKVLVTTSRGVNSRYFLKGNGC